MLHHERSHDLVCNRAIKDFLSMHAMFIEDQTNEIIWQKYSELSKEDVQVFHWPPAQTILQVLIMLFAGQFYNYVQNKFPP